jgi:hypothetical protein
MRGKLSLRKPNFWRRTQSSLSAPNLVTSFSRDKGKVLAALPNIPGARIDFNVDAQVQAILETVLGKPFKDRCARQEWGWDHRLGLEGMVD